MAQKIQKTCYKCREKYEIGTNCSCLNKHNKQLLATQGIDDRFYVSTPWIKLRKQIIYRDGAHCKRCYHKFGIINTSNLQVHHIIARSVNKALELEPTNLVTVCKTCNLQLGINGVDWDRQNEIKIDITPCL